MKINNRTTARAAVGTAAAAFAGAAMLAAPTSADALAPISVSASGYTSGGYAYIHIYAGDPSHIGVKGCVEDWQDGQHGGNCTGWGQTSVSATVKHRYAPTCTGWTKRLRVGAVGDGEPPRYTVTYVTITMAKSPLC